MCSKPKLILFLKLQMVAFPHRSIYHLLALDLDHQPPHISLLLGTRPADVSRQKTPNSTWPVDLLHAPLSWTYSSPFLCCDVHFARLRAIDIRIDFWLVTCVIGVVRWPVTMLYLDGYKYIQHVPMNRAKKQQKRRIISSWCKACTLDYWFFAGMIELRLRSTAAKSP